LQDGAGELEHPVPPPEAAERLAPDVALAPVVGWDSGGFRLGYGGGYFDRTLAVLAPRPFTIGIGLQAARLPPSFPNPTTFALDVILTEAGLASFEREDHDQLCRTDARLDRPAILTYGFRPFFFGAGGLGRAGDGPVGADAVGASDPADRL
jgi:hypothetical protein